MIVLAASGRWLAPAWLAPEDALAPCPAIVVLNGDPFSRAEEAARLYGARRGAEVWLTEDPKSSDAAGDGGSRSNASRLLSLGVPASAVRRVPGAATSTRTEMEAIGAELRRRGLECGIAVTSPIHARRVRLTWDRRVREPKLIVRLAPGGNYGDVLKELTGSLAVIAGLDR